MHSGTITMYECVQCFWTLPNKASSLKEVLSHLECCGNWQKEKQKKFSQHSIILAKAFLNRFRRFLWKYFWHNSWFRWSSCTQKKKHYFLKTLSRSLKAFWSIKPIVFPNDGDSNNFGIFIFTAVQKKSIFKFPITIPLSYKPIPTDHSKNIRINITSYLKYK